MVTAVALEATGTGSDPPVLHQGFRCGASIPTTHRLNTMSDAPADDDPDFEAIVEALLNVDPEGITGQTAGRDKKDDETDGD